MDRKAVAAELVKLAKAMSAASVSITRSTRIPKAIDAAFKISDDFDPHSFIMEMKEFAGGYIEEDDHESIFTAGLDVAKNAKGGKVLEVDLGDRRFYFTGDEREIAKKIMDAALEDRASSEGGE
jgi:hypothetical protein